MQVRVALSTRGRESSALYAGRDGTDGAWHGRCIGCGVDRPTWWAPTGTLLGRPIGTMAGVAAVEVERIREASCRCPVGEPATGCPRIQVGLERSNGMRS